MRQVFIIHGWDGASTKDWMPWAAGELKKLGYEVMVPDMPHTEAPTIDDWVKHLAGVVGTPSKDTYFIGHSIGCQTILRYFQTLSTPVGGAVFVAGWFNLTNLEGPEAEAIAEPWIKTPIDFAGVKRILPKSVAILSDNDPFVPFEETKKEFEGKLGAEVVIVPSAGHITESDGYGAFPQLIRVFQESF